MTDVATPEATEATAEAKSKPIQLTVPVDLKTRIEAKAAESGKSSARWALELIAKEFEYELPAAARVSTRGGGVKMSDVFAKSLSPEQKRERLAQAKLLLDGLARGVVNLDDIKAKLAEPAG